MVDATDPRNFAICLAQLSRAWRTELDRRLAPFGLTESRWTILLYLARYGEPVTQTALAAAVGVQGPTLVRALDRLEHDGLVERRAAIGDRRANMVHLTSRATPSLEQIRGTTEALRADLFTGLDAADIDACLRTFRRLSERLAHLGASLRADAGSAAEGTP